MSSPSAWLPALRRRLQEQGAGGSSDILVCRTLREMAALREAADHLHFVEHGRPARVGFVPTMGALHAGHLALADSARRGSVRAGDGAPSAPSAPPAHGGRHAPRADLVVASIFVNPTQFAPTEDLGKYPRTWDADIAALSLRGVDAVFAPGAGEMYPHGADFRSFVTLTDVDASSPEGRARPGFFRGVATVVTKLLNIVRPTDAYFGQKDGVQCIVVRTAGRDLNVPARIHVAPTVREADGLAMSSRNVYLSPAQRRAAPAIFRAMTEAGARAEAAEMKLQREEAGNGGAGAGAARSPQAARHVQKKLTPAEAEARAQMAAVAHNSVQAGGVGEPGSGGPPATPQVALAPSLAEAAEHVRRVLASEPEFGELQYAAFSDAATGKPLARLSDSTARNGAVLFSVAAKIGSTRLLDNIVLCGGVDDLGVPAEWAAAQQLEEEGAQTS